MGRTRADYERILQNPKTRALLNTISYAEGTSGPDGYRTMFGGGTFDDLSRHPDRVIDGGTYKSAAAGRYQFMPDTYREVSNQLGLSDFQPGSQDVAALALIDRRGALDPFLGGEKFGKVMNLLAPEWASLPTNTGASYYGQPVKGIGDLYQYYQSQSGALDKPLNTVAAPTSGVTQVFIGGEDMVNKKEKSSNLLDAFKEQLMQQFLPNILPF